MARAFQKNLNGNRTLNDMKLFHRVNLHNKLHHEKLQQNFAINWTSLLYGEMNHISKLTNSKVFILKKSNIYKLKYDSNFNNDAP